MRCLSSALARLPEYAALADAIGAGRLPAAATGLAHIHKALLIAALCRDTGRRALVVVADEAEAAALAQDLTGLGLTPLTLPARDLTLRPVAGLSREYERARVAALAALRQGQGDVILCSAEAARLRTLPPALLAAHTRVIKPGDTLPPEELAASLLAAGYARAELVEGAGQFARRGDIFDLYPPHLEGPVRLEYWGDEIDTVHRFDVLSQRRGEPLEAVALPPAAEVLIDDPAALADALAAIAKKQKKDAPARAHLAEAEDCLRTGRTPPAIDRFLPLLYPEATVFDYTEGFLTFLSESARVAERNRGLDVRLREEFTVGAAEGFLCKGLDAFYLDQTGWESRLAQSGVLYLDTFARGRYRPEPKTLTAFTLRTLSVWNGALAQFKEDALPLLEQKYALLVLAGTARAARTLADDLTAEGMAAALLTGDPAQLTPGTVAVTEGALSAGFDLPGCKVALITHGAVAAKRRKTPRSKHAFSSLEELHAGDYVVHAAHGIGVFEGVKSMTVDNVTKDYLRIRYAGQDVLYVPVTQLDLLSQYIGAGEEGAVKLHRLGGVEWQRTRARVKAAVKDIAKELIALYAKRMSQPGFAFSPDGDLQSDFERRFEYEETEDQLRCAAEIKADMERPSPMDRLLCGDVGFGKTEVALRAAFKCIADGKQCALLVPTTILAWQHYQTALRRLEGMPVTVEVLSRFRTPRQQTQIRRRLKSGEIDLIIGTHKLLGGKVEFRDLGLLSVDEEQRFGVAQKEKLRALAPNVDTLTLSATPIPRTLNMAMSGLRDMSTLEEAPADRSPVQTYVVEYDGGLLLDAIRRELRRGGQVYYLHNNTETIDRCAARLAAQLPDARIAVAHGKMDEDTLGDVWQRLLDGAIDILVCTTIIETGVDVPNVNTLIIENADRFGLAQLHQLRGRVGRSSRRAYAYLVFPPGKALSEIAVKRLDAIRNFTEFGSGFRIAMRDLEIRGAGNLLGGEQHGHLNAVGYDMYIKLLSDAVAEEKGETPAPDLPCTVDLPIGAHIPEDYIASLPARLGVYRRIADIRNAEDARDVIDELIDRFGEPPVSVTGLISVALLRNRCAALGFASVEQEGVWIRLYPAAVDPVHVAALAGAFKKLFRVKAGAKPVYEIRTAAGLTPLEILSSALDAVEGVNTPQNAKNG